MNDFEHKYSPEGNPYKVPEDYFELKQKELLAIADEPVQRKLPTYRVAWASGMAAAVLIAAFFLFRQNGTTETPLSQGHVEDYLFTEYSYGMTESVILHELEANDIALEEDWNFLENEAEEFLDYNFDQTLHYEYY